MTLETRRPVGRPPGSDGRERREQIIGVARLHFARGGYASTTLSAIAADVGISLASLYYYYRSKAQLYEAVFDDTSDRHWAIILDGLDVQQDFVTAFDQLIDTILTSALSEMREFLVNVPIEAKRHPELAGVMEKRSVIQQMMMRGLVEPAWRRGELARFSSVDEVMAALRMLLLGWSLDANFSADRAGLDTAAIRTVVRSMVEPPAGGASGR